jgi:myo-inositol-1(or 4)-monophosphatase
MADYRRELHAAAAAARLAGELIRYRAGNPPDVREKGVHDLVTQTDEEAQRIILDRLAEDFPDYLVLAEEGDAGDRQPGPPARRRWIVDPIDGTTNFSHGLPPYCVSIALQETDGRLVLGIVYEVSLDEMFTAVEGQGLLLNGRPAGVSNTGDLGNALVTTGFPFREFWFVDDFLAVLRTFMHDTRGIRRPGSAATDMAYVACGRFEAFFEAGLEPWDVAAGIVLVREGGGHVTGLTRDADPLHARQIAATNGRLHEAVLAITDEFGRKHLEGVGQRAGA